LGHKKKIKTHPRAPGTHGKRHHSADHKGADRRAKQEAVLKDLQVIPRLTYREGPTKAGRPDGNMTSAVTEKILVLAKRHKWQTPVRKNNPRAGW